MPDLFPPLNLPRAAGDVRLPARSIRDQGPTVDACMSCALAACMESWRQDYSELSPLSHYFWSKPGRLWTKGLTTEEGELGIVECGIARLAFHSQPFTPEGAAVEPNQQAVKDGFDRRLVQPETNRPRLFQLHDSDREYEWKKYLRAGRPILLVFDMNDSYQAMHDGKSHRWSGQGPGRGRHAAAIIGLSDAPSVSSFIVQDSRGLRFGSGGQWLLPYSEMSSRLICEAFAVGIAYREPL